MPSELVCGSCRLRPACARCNHQGWLDPSTRCGPVRSQSGAPAVTVQADAAPSPIEFAQEGSADPSVTWDLDVTDWTEDELHDPFAQALLGFRIEDGEAVAREGRAGRSLPGSFKDANPPSYSDVAPFTPGQSLLPKNPLVLKDSIKHSLPECLTNNSAASAFR